MFKHFATAVLLGVLGMVAGELIVWYAVSTWTQISSHWLNSAVVLPILGLWGGLALAEKSVAESRGRLRWLLILVAMPLCGAANYLAFVIASRTWFADKIPAEHQSFFFQLTHPDVLPAFGSTGSSGHSSSAESWLMYLILGLVLGPVVFWFTSRK